MAGDTAAFVELAAVVRAHGLKGDVIVKLFNEQSDLLLERDELLLRPPEGKADPIRVVSAQRHPKGALMRFDGIVSREGAEAMRGSSLGLARDQLPALDDDEIYYVDLIGLEARDGQGGVVGTIENVIDYPASTCLKIVSEDAQWEIPALERYLGKVDMEGGFVVIHELEELDIFKSARRES